LSVERWSLRANEAEVALPAEEVLVLLLLLVRRRRLPLLLLPGGGVVEGGLLSSSLGEERKGVLRSWMKRAMACCILR
jgi:hypothetical protein